MSSADRPGTIAEVIGQVAFASPRQVALVERPSDRCRTYAELLANGRRLAGQLADLNVARGDRVVFGMPSTIEHVEAYVACSLLGALPTPTHHEAGGWEIERVVEDARPTAIVCSESFWERAGAPQFGALLLGRESEPRAIHGAVGAQQPAEPDDAVLAYTSGTTGEPKAVRVTNSGLLNMYRHQCIAHRIPMYGKSVVSTQLSFVAATLDMLLAHMYSGSTVIFHERFDAEVMYSTLREWRPNFLHLAGPMVGDLHDLVAGGPLPFDQLKTVQVLGLSSLPERLLHWLVDAGGDRVMDAYGMTENSGGIVACTTYSDYGQAPEDVSRRLRSIGRPLAGLEVKVVDLDGKAITPNEDEVGEILVRGPSISPGFWNRADRIADDDGWYHTGDLATIDRAGYLFLRGRSKDTIKSGGATIYAAEIESCVKRLEGVRDSAAFGIPHERWGEALVIAIQPVPNRGVTAKAVIDHCARNLVGFKRPKSIWLVDELPRNLAGKVNKAVLKMKFEEAAAAGALSS